MKKVTTLFALAAIAGGSALAVVESKNTVGFQEFTGTGSFNLTVATFLPVGTDGSGMVLSNIVGNASFVPGTDYVNIYDGGTFLMDVTYSDPVDAAGWGIEPGWYGVTDYNNDAENNLNTTPLPYGVGFAFAPVTSGAGLKYVGELKEADNTLPASGTFNLCGNTTPKDITLANVKGNAEFVPGTDYVNLYNGGTFVIDITYSDPADAASWGIDPGWYGVTDYNNDAETNLNSTPIPAGGGFSFARTTAGARLIIENPVPQN